MEKLLKIEGMMCGNCSARVKKALEAIEGVHAAEVSHESGTAKIVCEGVEDAVLREAIDDQGFDLVSIS